MIEIFGKQYFPTWHRLATSAKAGLLHLAISVFPHRPNSAAGDRVIWLQRAVNWEVGQKLVLTTSIYKDNLNNQNEVRTITAVNGAYVLILCLSSSSLFPNCIR